MKKIKKRGKKSFARKHNPLFLFIFLATFIAVFFILDNNSSITGMITGVQLKQQIMIEEPLLVDEPVEDTGNDVSGGSEEPVTIDQPIIVDEPVEEVTIDAPMIVTPVIEEPVIQDEINEITISMPVIIPVTPDETTEENETEPALGGELGIMDVPTQGTPVLNTTNIAINDTNTNLTAYNVSAADADSDSVRSIFNWQVNGTSIAVLNMPFESVNGTASENAYDYSGFGNNGSDIGDVVWNATGGYDGRGAYEFDGIDTTGIEYLEIPDDDNLDFNSTNDTFTISFWAKHHCPTCVATDTVLAKGSSGSCIDNYAFATTGNKNGNMAFSINNGGGCGGISSVNSVTVLVAHRWYHFAGVYNGTSLLIYVNGSLDKVTQTSGVPRSRNTPLRIGWGHNIQMWNGTIDELMIFNRSLSAEQIWNLYANRTEMASQETGPGEFWNVTVTPNDGSDDGVTKYSNTLEILSNVPPTHGTPVLNTTNLDLNNTNTNLTAYNVSTADLNVEDQIKSIFNWQVNGSSIAVLNMPFESVNGTASENAYDYSGNGNNGSEQGGILWNSSGGYDGKGAYEFNQHGGSEYIFIPTTTGFSNTAITLAAWVKRTATTSTYSQIVGDDVSSGALYTDSSDRIFLQLKISDANKLTTMDDISTEWTHYVGTWASGEKLKLYKNGVLEEESTSAESGTLNAFTGFNIGYYTNSRYFNGTIDEVIIFNRSLSAEQVWNLYANRTEMASSETAPGEFWNVTVTPNDGSEDGITKYSNNVEIEGPPTHGTPVLNSTNLSSTNTNQNLTAYNISSADPNAGDSIKNIFNWQVNGTSITVLNMPFEGVNGTDSENAYDYSGYSNNGTEVSSPVWNSSGGFDGKGAYEFNNDAAYIKIPHDDNLNFNGTPFTISAWFKHHCPTCQSSDTLLSKGSAGSCLQNYALTFNGQNGNMQFSIGNGIQGGCGYMSQLNSVIVIGADKWYHVAGVYNGTSLLIYINGSENNILQSSNVPIQSSDSLYLGWGHAIHHWNGTIDEVLIFNRSLSAEQIWNLYANKTWQLASAETATGEYWNVSVTPNDGTEDGETLFSNTVKISDSIDCSPTLGANWGVSSAVLCDVESIDLTGYNITISTGGTLTLTGDTSIFTDNLIMNLVGDAVIIHSGSELVIN